MSQSARIKIKELRALLDDGLLSAQEFEQRKNAILDAQLAPSLPQLVGQQPPPAANAAPATELGLMAGQEIGPVNKRYRLEKFLGQGGMGQVWQALDLATHAELGQSEKVALKILPPQLTQSPLHTRLLIEEATQARKLAHEHIVRVYEWAQDPATTSYFLIMELLEGEDLHSHLHQHGPFDLAQVQQLLTPVAQGLRYAWEKHQLVHRDIKPGNLFLTRHKEVKLLDFGIAARLRSCGSALGLPLPGNVGTQGYRAPETGFSQSAPAPQIDVYSVAVMIYQLITGQLPSAAAKPPEGMNSAQWRVLQRAWAEQPQERPASVLDLLKALQLAGAPAVLQLNHPVDTQRLAREQAEREQARARQQQAQAQVQAEIEARLLQERQREQQARKHREQQERANAAQKLKQVALKQQEQLAQMRAREQLEAEKQRRARELQKETHKKQLLEAEQRAMQQAAQRIMQAPAQTAGTDVSYGEETDWMATNPPEMPLVQWLPPPPPPPPPPSAAAEPRQARHVLPCAVGDSFRDAYLDGRGAGPEMLILPAGRFLMGSSDAERMAAMRAGSQRAWLERETPQHWVQLSQPFAMAKYPVTVGEWRQFVLDTGWRPDDDEGSQVADFVQDEFHPVVCVSWRDACQYLAWLTQKTGQTYRLPSESEWEYACRAGTTSAFCFGDSINPEQANYDGNFTYNGGPKGRFARGTSRVGCYPPNPWGLCDMHGNVWEWVADVVHDNYQAAPSDGSAWMDGGDQGRRILRGGCWLYNPRYLRSALRNAFWVAGKNDIVGFRVVRELEAMPETG